MPRFFTDTIQQDTAYIIGEDAKHITKVLRMKQGEKAVLCDGKGADYLCEAVSFGETVTFHVCERIPNTTEPSVRISLYQAMPKQDKLELIVQKAVELGAYEVIPVLTERCVARPDEAAMQKRLQRLSRISLEAAKQSGRGIIPTIGPMVHFKEAISMMNRADLGILCYECGGKPLGELVDNATKAASLALMIGSEGGFEPEEAALAAAAGIKLATLGSRILRCETAPISALSILLHLTGNM